MSTIKSDIFAAPNSKHERISTFLAIVVILAWIGNLYWSLTLNTENILLIIFQAWLQSFLFVGMFVSAHDCMHGLVAPSTPKVNDAIGTIALFLFAGFRYKVLRQKHHQHHDHPTSTTDPDYTRYSHERFWPWIASFMRNYFGLREFLILHLHVGVVLWVGGMVPWKIFVFYAIPSWIASIQLFYFGTYLVHKGFQEDSNNVFKSRSNTYPTWLSLITCFHFGYHIEHHEYPFLAWWRLPKAYQYLRQ